VPTLRAALFVAVLVATVGGLPLTASAAPGPPRDVTVAVHNISPFVMTQGDVKSGFTIDLLDEVAKRLNWNIEYVDVANVKEQLAAVADRSAEVAAGAISITSERSQSFDFSQPIFNAGLQILVPQSNTGWSIPGLTDFLRLLFSQTMLVWLGVGLLLTVLPAHVIWLLERRNPRAMVAKSYIPGIFHAFGWGMGMLAGQPDGSPRNVVARTVGLLWAFVGIIFVAYYTATLTANLTVDKFDAQISTPADLLGKKVCTVANTTSSNYLGSLGIPATDAPQIDECFEGLRTQQFEAVVFDAPILRYYVATDGAGVARLSGPIFKPEDYGIVFDNGSDLRKQFNETLLAIREDGTYDLIDQKWFGDEFADADAG
jgi:polar amino acid transport system substrate-binding protein